LKKSDSQPMFSFWALKNMLKISAGKRYLGNNTKNIEDKEGDPYIRDKCPISREKKCGKNRCNEGENS